MSDELEILPSLAYRDFTPLPEKLKGWHGNDPIFMDLIFEVKPKLIIEVGSWLGQSAINMANCLKSHAEGLENTKIICVDTWLGALEFMGQPAGSDWDLMAKNGYPQVYYQFLSNVMHWGHEDIIIPFPQTSVIAARYFAKNDIEADMIYIDGSHDYPDVYQDLECYWPRLKKGGVIFGDDYNSGTWPGVVNAVQDFFSGLQDVTVEERNFFWYVKKTH